MLKNLRLLSCIAIFSVLYTLPANAQSGQIDTIVVDLVSDTTKKKASELRPTLNLDALRKAAREDSIAIANMAKEKEAAKQKSMEELKAKRLLEKEKKEKQLKELAEKRKIEKEAREKAFAKKKAKKEEAEKKKKVEKKEAKLKKIENKLAKEKELAKKKEKARLEAEAIASKKKEENSITKKEIEAIPSSKIDSTLKTNKLSIDAPNPKEKETSKTVTESFDSTSEKEKVAIKKATRDPVATGSKKEKEMPQVPAGVEQKDNVYGTVRLAYDEQAASFLLSIPTETKMHYHKDHSEQLLLIEGQGMVLLGYKTIKLKKNELIFITKGTPHKIINSGRSKLKVLSIQAPFYDGSDKIILE
jgi:mannose-6-phosphate isomerase-like protein (cupin superfamily)